MNRSATKKTDPGAARRWAPVIVFGLVCAPMLAFGGETDLRKLADRLIELRGKVETLNDDIESRQQQHRNTMTSLAQRRAELDGQVQRQDLEIEKLRRALDEVRAQREQIEQASAAMRPAAEDAAKRLEAYVQRSLPFTTEQRRADLIAIRTKLAKGEISSPRALNQLWSFVEDELRLARGSGIFRQTIRLEGTEQLADVVRVGLVMLFFRTGDGRYGYAERAGEAWRFVTVQGEDAHKTTELFEAFERQVRTGYFDVPNPLAGGLR